MLVIACWDPCFAMLIPCAIVVDLCRMKTEFLVRLEGASSSSDERILVVGATNRPHDLVRVFFLLLLCSSRPACFVLGSGHWFARCRFELVLCLVCVVQDEAARRRLVKRENETSKSHVASRTNVMSLWFRPVHSVARAEGPAAAAQQSAQGALQHCRPLAAAQLQLWPNLPRVRGGLQKENHCLTEQEIDEVARRTDGTLLRPTTCPPCDRARNAHSPARSGCVPGYSGADMRALCTEAAFGPLRSAGDIASISHSRCRPAYT